MIKELTCSALFECGHSAAERLIFSYEYPFEVLPHIGDFILELGKGLQKDKYYSPSEGIWIAKNASVSPLATISAPCIIGENTEIRQAAFIRGKALIGNDCVIGNSVELKNCIISDGCQVPHFNYIGDSILGYKAHMGAGSVTSNVKSDKTLIGIAFGNEKIETGLRKFGAILGDFTEIGCNSVLNPGTVIGKSTNVYPLCSVRGYVPPHSIYKGKGDIAAKIY